MASISKNSSNRLSEAIKTVSEEDFDLLCNICLSLDGKRLEPVAFCMSCQEYLCSRCQKYHKEMRATRNHVLQDSLQKSTASEERQPGTVSIDVVEPIEDRCPKHYEEPIKFFCSRHQQLACNICVVLHHRTCDESVSYIPDISRGVAQSDELQNVLAELRKLIEKLETSQKRTKWCQQQTEENYNQLISDIKLCRQRINQHFDRLEKELLLQVSRLIKEKIDSLTSQMPACDILIGKIKGINCDLDKKRGLKHNSQLFIALQAAKKKIKTWENEANKIITSAQASHFVFSQDAKLEEVTTVERLGTVSANEFSSARVKFLQDINIKLATDKKDCTITGIAPLADGCLAVTDFYNPSVKLVDTAACRVAESISLTSAPMDITVVDVDQLAVVLYGQEHIQLVSLTPKLSLSHTLPMPGRYNGITYSNGNLILACCDPVLSVHICDMSGRLLHQIDTDNLGNKLFTSVSRVAVSSDQSTIYISDFRANKVVCFNRAGVVIETYNNARLRWPWGVYVDERGCVLVCSCKDHSLHLLDGEGRLVKVLLVKQDGLRGPRAVACRRNNIYISSGSPKSEDRNIIKAFTLEQ